MKKLKIFIYDEKYEIIKEYKYEDLIVAINETFDHNFLYEEDQWNLIYDFDFHLKNTNKKNKNNFIKIL